MSELETIQTTIQRVCYRNSTGWSIIRTERGSCLGVIGWEPREGDMVELQGSWARSLKTGADEFKFTGARMVIPDDSRALLRYAVSITKGMGPAAEAAIWDQYGDTWREQDTLDVRGVGESTMWHWQDTLRRLQEQEAQSTTISFLLAHGCSMNLACSAWAQWGDDTYGLVTTNPYTLTDLPHYGFIAIDASIRREFGIEDADPRRVDAAVLYVLGDEASRTGGTLVSPSRVAARIAEICPDGLRDIDESVARLTADGKLCDLGVPGLALRDDHDHAVEIWRCFGNQRQEGEWRQWPRVGVAT